MWFTSRMEVTSIELCFYYSLGEGKHSSTAQHMQLKIFLVTLHTAWSPSLLDLFSYLYIASLTIYSSLSVNPYGLLHTDSMTHRQAKCLDLYKTVCLADY